MRRLIAGLVVTLVVVAVIFFISQLQVTTISTAGTLSARELQEASVDADVRILFVGNSLTYTNRVDELVRQLCQAAKPQWKHVYAKSLATPSARFAQHAQALDDEPTDQALRQLLISGPEKARRWDYVVLQEQSQTLGFPIQNIEKQRSLIAAERLHQAITASGAKTVLMMTWGFASGDKENPELYPDFKTMSAAIESGYRNLASSLSKSGKAPLLAPAGVAFRLLSDHALRRGQDPLKGRFGQLYQDDRHQSLAGAYLAAATIAATITGEPISGVSWAPEGLEPELARELRQTADEAIASIKPQSRPEKVNPPPPAPTRPTTQASP